METSESLRDLLIRKGWVTDFNADTLVKLIEKYYAARVEPEVVGPTDEELTLTYAYAVAKAVDNRRGPFTKEEAEAAQLAGLRAVLARWGNHFPDTRKMVSPAADGEVAELVAWLRQRWPHMAHIPNSDYAKGVRAADLLEQRHPAPPAAEEVGYAKDVRRMCDIILGNTFGNEELDSLALLVGHHADVLNAAPPVEGEVADEARYLAKELRDQSDDLSPSLELFGLIHRAADLLSQRHPTPAPPAEIDCPACEGRPKPGNLPCAVCGRSAPPVEGDVAELVAWLRLTGEGQPRLSDEGYAQLTRAADLLEQRHPAPVPVVERLPGPEDCDENGDCWFDTGTDVGWMLCDKVFGLRHGSRWWLPFNALPLPQGEVE